MFEEDCSYVSLLDLTTTTVLECTMIFRQII